MPRERGARPAVVRFYIDADLLGLAKILVQLRSDVTYPGDPGGPTRNKRMRPPCPITEVRTDDDVWIAETARQGWLAITRDRHILDRAEEVEAVRSNGARLVNLAGEEAVTVFTQFEVLMTQWRLIEPLYESETGPFIYSVTRTTFRKLPLS